MGTQLGDNRRAVALIESALALNPLYSARLWNIKGEALALQELHAQAHDCYETAARIHSGDAGPSCFLRNRGWSSRVPVRSVVAVARGLANDTASMFRHQLLETQRTAVSVLAARRQDDGLPESTKQV